MYVTTEEELASLVDQLQDCDTLAVDTEFVREKTYFHRLGLIQVASNGLAAAVDPIAIKDLTPLLDLLRQPDKIKVFHAGKQDLEILYKLCGEVVQPLFDTQVAAAMIGWGAQISFAKAVHKVTGKKISKSETYTDWCRRPLRDSQIEYAINDVRYLIPVYEKLVKQLKSKDRLEWVQQELLSIFDEKNFALPDPQSQFLKIKSFRSLKPQNLAVLRELAGWRLEQAVQRDCLAKSILRDEPMLEIARALPRDLKKLGEIRGVHSRELSQNGKHILSLIEKGLQVPESEYPVVPETNNYSTGRGVEELLAAYVQIRSQELKVEPHLLADRKQIHSFVKAHELKDTYKEHSLLQGWRKDLIGNDLHLILEGRQGLGIDQGKVGLIPYPKK